MTLLKKFRQARLKTRLLHPWDECWDRKLGISTFGYVPRVGDLDAPDMQMHYGPTPYRGIFRIIRRLGLGADDVLVDFGSGLGRFVFSAAWGGCGRSIGVEINDSLYAQSLDNLARSRVEPGRVEFSQTFAQHYDPTGVTCVYMFHPFGPGTVGDVIRNLECSIEAQPRRVQIAYKNPVHADVVDASHAFRRTDDWEAEGRSLPYAVSFWETVAG